MTEKDTWRRLWYGGTPGVCSRLLLTLPSILYGALVGGRNVLYDRGHMKRHQLPRPVISIGNITVGGTGKTPLTIRIAEMVQSMGFRPAIVSRGYGGTGEGTVNIVTNGRALLSTPTAAGDEPVLMAEHLPGVPILTGADRVAVGKEAIRLFSPHCLICDDAFQHRRLHRDLDIVLLDTHAPFGNGHLLPLGPLREPPSSLRRASLIVFTSRRTVTSPPLPSLPAGVPTASADLAPVDLYFPTSGRAESLSFLKGKRVCAVAGIADPEAFHDLILSSGGLIVSRITFPDHHCYSSSDGERIMGEVRRTEADLVVTTEKDGVKLGEISRHLPSLAFLRVKMEIRIGEEGLKQLLYHTITGERQEYG